MTEKLVKKFTIIQLPDGGYITSAEVMEAQFLQIASPTKNAVSAHSKLGGQYTSYTERENAALSAAEAFFTTKPLDTPA